MYEEEIHFGKLLLKQLETGFGTFDPSDLNLWPKINRVPPATHDGCLDQVWSRSRCSCVIHQKRFRHIWSRWPWPLTQWLKINWIPLLPRMDVWTKFEEGRSRHFLSYWSETVFTHLTPVKLTFDPVTPKSIEFLCYSGWMYGTGMKKVGQGPWPSDPKIYRISLLPMMDV